jgi:hypothetical protein
MTRQLHPCCVQACYILVGCVSYEIHVPGKRCNIFKAVYCFFLFFLFRTATITNPDTTLLVSDDATHATQLNAKYPIVLATAVDTPRRDHTLDCMTPYHALFDEW